MMCKFDSKIQISTAAAASTAPTSNPSDAKPTPSLIPEHIRKAKRHSWMTGQFDNVKALEQIIAVQNAADEKAIPEESEAKQSPALTLKMPVEFLDSPTEEKISSNTPRKLSPVSSPIRVPPPGQGRVVREGSFSQNGGVEDDFSANTFTMDQLKPSLATYTLDQILVEPKLPAEIPMRYREMYLRDDIFLSSFGLTKPEFLSLPRWRQVRKKRELGFRPI
jgi:hypothetical protein